MDQCKQLKTAKLVAGRYYRDMVVALVREHEPVSREDVDRLLLNKLPEVLTQAQKLNRIHNLLRQLAEAGVIVNQGSRRWPRWVLVPPPQG